MPCYTIKHLRSSQEVQAACTAASDRLGRMPTMDEIADELAARGPDPHVEHRGYGMFLCGDLGPQCTACGDVSNVLCDYPVGDEKTCDRALCSACTEEVAPDVHYCAGHLAVFRKFEAAGGVEDKLRNLVPFRPMTRPGRKSR
jgi:hypothetical protein